MFFSSKRTRRRKKTRSCLRSKYTNSKGLFCIFLNTNFYERLFEQRWLYVSLHVLDVVNCLQNSTGWRKGNYKLYVLYILSLERLPLRGLKKIICCKRLSSYNYFPYFVAPILGYTNKHQTTFACDIRLFFFISFYLKFPAWYSL